jgi:hypothetical protein
MNTFNPTEHPHRRYNALNGDWILVSPHRTQRPWQGQVERPPQETRPAHDPTCYLCPGNERAGGKRNPDYASTFVFVNDFSALLPDSPPAPAVGNPLLQAEGVQGECRVICFSPRHDLTLPEMPVADIRHVVDVWAEQTVELGQRYRWVQVFENKGAVMGCSNPHPHGQIWAGSALPHEPAATFVRGEAHQPETHLIPLVLQVALGQRESIAIFGDDYPTPDGACVRDYIHIEDLASAHVLALDALDERPFMRYNLGNGAGYSVLEVIETARRVTGHPIPAVVRPRRPGDPAMLMAGSGKIQAELGWQPQQPDLAEIIDSAWRWHLAHPRGYEEGN